MKIGVFRIPDRSLGSIRVAGMALSNDRDLWHTPPADAIFLHRKVVGLYLLAARLKARVNVRELAQACGLVPAVGR